MKLVAGSSRNSLTSAMVFWLGVETRVTSPTGGPGSCPASARTSAFRGSAASATDVEQMHRVLPRVCT